MNPSLSYAQSQADAYDNIAPTPLQGQQAWQYAQSDNFFSPEEQTAVLQKQLEAYRPQIEAKLTQVGYPPETLAKYPDFENALYSGQKTAPVTVLLSPELEMKGCLRIVMTETGPEIRITPAQQSLTIPDEIEGVRLSKGEKQQLVQEGALPRPFMIADEANRGLYVPTYLRIDDQTNTVELWRIRPENLPTKLMGIDLTRDQQLQLANGHAVRLSGLLDQQGEAFNATVSISAAQKEIQFSDFSRLGVSLKPDATSREQLALNNEGAKTDLTRSQEVATGAPVLSNHQREAMQQLLGDESSPRLSTPKQRLS